MVIHLPAPKMLYPVVASLLKFRTKLATVFGVLKARRHYGERVNWSRVTEGLNLGIAIDACQEFPIELQVPETKHARLEQLILT
jgi:hypothetical protein